MEEYTIKVNPFEAGMLFGLILEAGEETRQRLNKVWEQLVTFKKQAEADAGVTKEVLPGGLLKITDKDGNVITRAPFPYELEGN